MYSDIVRMIEECFPQGVYLGYVDYDDGLTEEQAEWYIMGDIERVFDSISEWEYENRFHGADYYLEELERHALKNDPNFEPDYDWFERVREVLMDLDRSDILGDLVKGTRYAVTLCKWLIDEDNAVWGKHDVDGLIEALGVPNTADNRTVADELIANAPTDLGMAFAAYEVTPADLQGIEPGRAAIRSEHLPICYGNPFTGGYDVGAFKLAEPVVIPLSELTPESHFVAYGPSEVYGGFPYELESEVEFIGIDN